MRLGAVLLFGAFAAVVPAQDAATTRLEFEVATVKLVDPPRGPHPVGLRIEHGTARLEGATLRQIIVQAYLVQRVRVLGGPAWYDMDQYDVVAKAEAPNATPAEIRQMLQALLADRFKLAVHREAKTVPMYSLVVGKNGPAFQEAKTGETSAIELGDPRQIVFRRQPLASLINTLANMMDTPIDDMTGLKAMYDYKLEWAVQPAPGQGPLDARDFVDGAVEKLGLKLENKKGTTEVLLVDHAERPSAN